MCEWHRCQGSTWITVGQQASTRPSPLDCWVKVMASQTAVEMTRPRACLLSSGHSGSALAPVPFTHRADLHPGPTAATTRLLQALAAPLRRGSTRGFAAPGQRSALPPGGGPEAGWPGGGGPVRRCPAPPGVCCRWHPAAIWNQIHLVDAGNARGAPIPAERGYSSTGHSVAQHSTKCGCSDTRHTLAAPPPSR